MVQYIKTQYSFDFTPAEFRLIHHGLAGRLGASEKAEALILLKKMAEVRSNQLNEMAKQAQILVDNINNELV